MDATLEKYIEMVSFLGNTLDNTHEIILFDMTQRNYPMIAHSKKTNETVNATRKLVTSALKDKKVKEKGCLLNTSISYEFGKLLKSSVYLIKNPQDVIVGALCMNINCGVYFQMQALVSSVLSFDSVETDDAEFMTISQSTHNEPTLDTITQIIDDFGVEPGRHTSSERAELMCDLYDQGVFDLKGSVAKVAEALSMSEQSVYRHLSKIRKARS